MRAARSGKEAAACGVWASRVSPVEWVSALMLWRAIRSFATCTASASVRRQARRASSPCIRRKTASAAAEPPRQQNPPLRPDAPQPGVSASNTRTSCPASARCSAADSPVNPAPITATSQAIGPSARG